MLLNDVGHLLGGDDGQFKASKTWAFEWLHRHNLSSRVATKAVPGKVPSVEVTRDFQHRIALAVHDHRIPPDLCLNFDQTSCYLLPVSDYTYAEKGSKQVAIRFAGDKRNITALLAGSAVGEFLPEQLIFQGETDRCLPKAHGMPPGWLLSHSTNHWSSDETMKEWLQRVAVPWCKRVIKAQQLPKDQRALLIFDCWAKHKTQWWIDFCMDNGFEVVFVPGLCVFECYLHNFGQEVTQVCCSQWIFL